MTIREDNVIEFPAPGARAALQSLGARNAEGEADRFKEATDLLNSFRHRKRRLDKNDRATLVCNLGRLIAEMERTNPEALVKRILPRNKWEKRMRYVRLPGDASDAPYAASAGDFAGIIDRLIDEKVNARRDRAQATIETVYQLFKGTSFLPPPRFQIAEGEHEEALVLINEMEKVSAKLSHEVDLAEHFERVSKYPIYPNCPYLESSNSLTLDAKCEPNDIYDWDWLSDEDEFDLQNCIPWWAPRCVIGHLYVPFGVNCLRLPEQGIADLKKACGGEVTQDAWSTQYSQLLEPFLRSEHIRQTSIPPATARSLSRPIA